MTLLGKIFTVLIFIMSVAFCILAVATFATHKNWKLIATNPAGPTKGLKEQLDDQQKLYAELQRQHLDLQAELAMEQAARRAALGTLQSKVSTLVVQLDNYAAQLKEKDSALTAQTSSAKTAEETLAAITAEVKKLREDIRISQQDRNEQFNRAVKITDDLNQAISLKLSLEEKHRQLVDQYTALQKVAQAMGFDERTLVSEIPPRLEGVVTKVNETSGLVEINLGSDDGLKRGHDLQIYRASQYLGEIELIEVNADTAVGVVNKRLQKGRIREKDNVTTKLS